jgi:hypothetical protein
MWIVHQKSSFPQLATRWVGLGPESYFRLSLVHLTVYASHCADGVLSFANMSNLVGDIATVVMEFSSRWVQTPSDYDFLVADTMPAEWCQTNQPVLSRHGKGHSVYSKFSFGRPNGMLVLCHRRCDKVVTSRDMGKGRRVQYKCEECGSRCTTARIQNDRTTNLGRRSIVKAEYPLALYPVEWKLEESESSLPTPAASMPPPPPPFRHSSSSDLRKSTYIPENKHTKLNKKGTLIDARQRTTRNPHRHTPYFTHSHSRPVHPNTLSYPLTLYDHENSIRGPPPALSPALDNIINTAPSNHHSRSSSGRGSSSSSNTRARGQTTRGRNPHRL